MPRPHSKSATGSGYSLNVAVAGSLVEKVIDAFQHTPELQTLVLDDGGDTLGVGIALNRMRRDAGLAPVEISHSPPGSPAWWDAMRG